MDVLPHQLEPALAVMNGARRLLIADEVGLGKTIQAGLVIAELHRRWPALRALIIVPAALGEQWRQEIGERFGIRAEIADRDALDGAARHERAGANPWNRAGVRIVSADFLKQTHVRDAVTPIPWDVVVSTRLTTPADTRRGTRRVTNWRSARGTSSCSRPRRTRAIRCDSTGSNGSGVSTPSTTR